MVKEPEEKNEKSRKSTPELNPELLMQLALKYSYEYFGEEKIGEILSGQFDIKKSKKIPTVIKLVDAHMETVKMASTEIWRNLTSVTMLCASLLVVASFRNDLSLISTPLRVLISILLILIPSGLWGFYKNFSDGSIKASEHMKKAIESVGGDISDLEKIEKDSKKSFFGKIPFIINFILTLVVLGILVLMWNDIFHLFKG